MLFLGDNEFLTWWKQKINKEKFELCTTPYWHWKVLMFHQQSSLLWGRLNTQPGSIHTRCFLRHHAGSEVWPQTRCGRMFGFCPELRCSQWSMLFRYVLRVQRSNKKLSLSRIVFIKSHNFPLNFVGKGLDRSVLWVLKQNSIVWIGKEGFILNLYWHSDLFDSSMCFWLWWLKSAWLT